MAKKSFNEKLQDSRNMPEIIEITDPKAIMRFGGSKMLIAPPLQYDERLKEIKKIIEGGAESMPFVSWYFVRNVEHGHNYEKSTMW